MVLHVKEIFMPASRPGVFRENVHGIMDYKVNDTECHWVLAKKLLAEWASAKICH